MSLQPTAVNPNVESDDDDIAQEVELFFREAPRLCSTKFVGDPFEAVRGWATLLPRCSRAALTILAIPPSSAASERSISAMNLFVTRLRMSMKPDLMQASVRIKQNQSIHNMFKRKLQGTNLR